MSRTILNIDGTVRTINPRNGTSIFVDLSSNQIIGGTKRFLNNLITNSDVNFNTTANLGRIIFNSNEPAGSGSQIVSIYTQDEIDGLGWFFDSVGNLYYLGGGLIPVKIMLSGTTGDLTILNTFNSGNITSTGTISCVDISSTNIIYARSINMQETGFLNVNNITSSVATGAQTKIALSNEFIDTNNSSLDIIATYIGFGNPQQTLDILSKYMFIKPLSDGNFDIQINNIASKVLSTNWSTLTLTSDFNLALGSKNITTTGTIESGDINANGVLSLRNTSSLTNILLNPTTTSGNRLLIYGITSGTKFLYYNTSNNIGVFNTATGANVWSIDGTTGDINTIGTLTYATLSAPSLSTNSISPISPSTTININTTSNFNWLKSVGVHRIKFFPSSISGDIMRIFRSGDDDANFGYWYFNNNGEFGFSFNGATVWSVFVTGNMRTTNTIQAPIFSALTAYTYTNRIQMENLFFNASIASIDMRSQYIGFAHPNNALSALSKYGAIVTTVGGDVGFSINNISGYAWGTDWANRLLYSDYTFQCQKSSFVVNYRYQKFMNNVTEIGSITMLTASSIAFNNTSDYRLKQDIKPLEKSLERLMKLQPKSYRFIKDVEEGQDFTFDGFLAHEVSDIIPMAVSGTKDDPENFQQMDYSKLTPLLTGAVQELNIEVQELNKEVEELKISNKSLLDIIDKLIIRVEKLEYNLT